MAEFPKFDEEFKQNVSEKFQNVKEKVSDAILTEEGKLDTERIGSAVTEAAKRMEEGVRDSYQKFSDEYVKDGSLDKEKLGETAKRTYRKAGRALATGVSKLADFLTDKFGTQDQNGEIVDSEIVVEPENASVVTAEPEDFVTEEAAVEEPAAETPAAEEPAVEVTVAEESAAEEIPQENQ